MAYSPLLLYIKKKHIGEHCRFGSINGFCRGFNHLRPTAVTLESTKKRRRKKNTSTGIWGEVSYDGI
jgi:hypothetical protein